MSYDDDSPISASEARRLFAGFKNAPALVLAVSGGPDSVALMWLAARWRKALSRGPQLLAVTVDHALRAESAREAAEVKRLARTLDLPHRTLRWSGTKPKTGMPAAAREARYGLLVQAARSARATHIVTAHTRDDQAETLLMRLLRGSGIAGLSAMAAAREHDGLVLARPLLNVPKSRLIATLNKARIAFADDPTNRDTAFTRSRLRALMPQLAAEGGDTRALARVASRLARANAAVEVLADGAERFLALKDPSGPRPKALQGGDQASDYDAAAFAAMPEEIRLRLLMRAINRVGHEGPAELAKVETMLAEFDRIFAEKGGKRRKKPAPIRLKFTLAGALVSLDMGRIRIMPAPPRRRGRSNSVIGGKWDRKRPGNAPQES